MMSKMGPATAKMPKGMDEFFSFIRLLNDDDAYQDKAAKLAEQIARYEELVGAHNTLQAAEAVQMEVNRLKIKAEALLMQARKEVEAMRADAGKEIDDLRRTAKQESDKAHQLLNQAEKRDADTREHTQKMNGEFARRERDVTAREKNASEKESVLNRQQTELNEKIKTVNSLFS
jgi:hypothetical protein